MCIKINTLTIKLINAIIIIEKGSKKQRKKFKKSVDSFFKRCYNKDSKRERQERKTTMMMMNRLREVADTLIKADDLYLSVVKGDEATIMLNDFDGFDEDWHEIHRKYKEPQLVNELLDLLEPYMNKEESDLYEVYELPNFTIILGYTSFDI